MSLDHPAEALPPGTRLGSYEIQRVLGRGGFGITYAARRAGVSGEMTAIKELFPSEICTRERSGNVVSTRNTSEQHVHKLAEMFLREGRIICSIQHPNIVQGLECFEANGTAYLVMRYVSGKTLLEHLRMRSGGFSVTPLSLVNLLVPLMDALAMLHAKEVLHCDIKPDNIFLGVGYHPILIDLGAARFRDPSFGWESADTYFPHFAAIEQHTSRFGQMGPWTDIYQLSAVAYRCITGGKLPDSIERANSKEDPYMPLVEMPDVRRVYPRSLLEAFDWGLRIYPDERPRSVEEWHDRILPAVKKLGGLKSPPPLPPQARPAKRESMQSSLAGKRSCSQSTRREGGASGADPLVITGLGLAAVAILIVGVMLLRTCG